MTFLCAGHSTTKSGCQWWGLISAEEPNVSTALTIWARSLSWTDFMSFLITHNWKRANSECESVRAKAERLDRRGKMASTIVGQIVFFHRENVTKKKKELRPVSIQCNGTASGRRGLVGRILDVSCEERVAGGADLWCEEALLVLQVVAHAVLEDLAEGVVPAGRREGKVTKLHNCKEHPLQLFETQNKALCQKNLKKGQKLTCF